MMLSTFRLRMAMRLARSSSKDKTKDESFSRKQMSGTHGYLFLLMGISMATNLNTSLLTEKVFRCQNFANKCLVAYMFFISVASFVALFLCELDFSTMVMSEWMLVTSHSMHVLVGMFGNGMMARNIFILGYGINGALEAFICFSATTVISKLFLNSTYSMIFTGFPAGSIFLGTTQTILNRVVGTATISQMRKNLVLCHGCHVVLSAIGYLWVTFLYIKYGHFVKEDDKKGEGEQNKTEEKKLSVGQKILQTVESFRYARYYYSRLILVVCAYLLRYFFFPCLIPFVLDIPHHIKLIGSLSLTISEFISKLNTVSINEAINPSEKDPSQSHAMFLLMRDASLHFAMLASIGSSSFILWSSLTGRYHFSKSPIFIFCFIVMMGISYGYLSTRSINGCKPVLDYYTKQLDEKGKPMVEEKVANGPGVSDVATLTINVAVLFISVFSDTTEGLILKYKGSRAYIINNSKGDLSIKAVDALLMQFKS
ncbi:conserved hypothetical protein [Theileria equi strain WA]|uniref:Uncharacterized protein n=1 Tax=Theileria equi strain WA TaxID=1537102 RepID=L1LA43_THEEQ|nr:conserved hypothetical protein [Theileria equi strain WA]EKX72100.1 conserved hypothetical protein [Theileria equi strain WA]|eukprot:XP_004831552.1 conserved hypothetical protein [Theileria equi strain WA]